MLLVSVAAPHRWLQLNRSGKVRRRGSAETLAELARTARGDSVYAVIPGEHLVTHRVTVPARSRARAAQALPFALEERLTEDIERFHFLMLGWKSGGEVLAGILSKDLLDGWWNGFEQAGIRLAGMLADYQLLPLHPRCNITIARDSDDRICVRMNDGGGAVLDADALAIWWHGTEQGTVAAVNERALAESLVGEGGEVRLWEIGAGYGDWIAHRGGKDPMPNLLPMVTGTRSERSTIPGLKVAVVLLGLGVLAKGGLDAYEYRALEGEADRLERAIHDQFVSTFPEETRVVNARSQFRQKLLELEQAGGAGGDFQALLAAVARAVDGAGIEELVFRDESLEVLCSVNNFADLDALKRRLEEAAPVQVELVSSGSLGDRVTGRYRLVRLPG